jgi:hypothetical protein
MRKTIRHKWTIASWNVRKCVKCRTEEIFDHKRQIWIYYDRFGNNYYKIPPCVMPNTKL